MKPKISKIDLLFLIIFVIFLFAPSVKINNSEISEFENKTLPKKPKLNSSFFVDFDNWFCERFFLRENLISFYWLPLSKFQKHFETKEVIKGDEGWLFYKGQNGIQNYQNLFHFNNFELLKAGQFLNEIDYYCKKNNKIFIFLIAPDKSKIYPEFYPKTVNKIYPDKFSRANQLLYYLKENSNVNFFYPYLEFYKAKNKDYLYYKTDTHWNSYGAYIVFKALFKEGEFSFSKEKNKGGDLIKMLPRPLKYEDKTVYKKVTPKKNPKNLKVYINGDSFTYELLPFFESKFKEVEFKKDENVVFEKDIKDKNIVIIELAERRLYNLTKMEFKN